MNRNQYAPSPEYGEKQRQRALERSAPGVPSVPSPRSRDAHQAEQKTPLGRPARKHGPKGRKTQIGHPPQKRVGGEEPNPFKNPQEERYIKDAVVFNWLASLDGASPLLKQYARTANRLAEPYLRRVGESIATLRK